MNNPFYENHLTFIDKMPYIFHSNSRGCAPHWHENVEILLFYTAGTMYSDQEFYEVRPGDIAVINSDAVHTIPLTAGILYDCLIVDSRYCADNGVDVAEINFSVVINDKVAERLFKAVSSEVVGIDGFSDAAVRSSILELAVYLARNHSNGIRRDSSKLRFIKRAIKYINSRLGERISVDDIAGHVSMSKYHFCREFKKETGYTVVGYANLMRCLRAKKLLSTGEYTVAEAARECGFENLSYFSKTFKEFVGALPASVKKTK